MAALFSEVNNHVGCEAKYINDEVVLFKKLLIAIKYGDLSNIREEIALYIASFRLYMLNFLQYIFMVQFLKKLA